MTTPIRVFLDLDGVLADLHAGIKNTFDYEFPKDRPSDCEKIKIAKMWYEIYQHHPGFWENLPVLHGAEQIVQFAKLISNNVSVLTATPEVFSLSSPEHKRTAIEKTNWVEEHFPGIPVIATKSKLKQTYIEPISICILVDDHPGNIERWKAAGGIGIQYKTLSQTLDEMIQYVGKNLK